MINPHGGALINRVAPEQEKQSVLSRVQTFKTLVLDKEKITDAKNIAFGVFSPLIGFMKKNDFENVVSSMRLSNGLLWPIPIVLDISQENSQRLTNEKDILLINESGQPIALMEDIEIYSYDKDSFVKNVFGTNDQNHPGVNNVYQMNDYLVGGRIKLIDSKKDIFPEYYLTPQETRDIFQKNNWQTIAAFQTRNVPHRGHEFLQKQALQQTDGLFIQPVIGQKKIEDFKDEFILSAYQLLIDRFFPKNKVVLGILPLKMKYAGPREAILHALVRKNFGCSHFIVGRDHAGVGNFYGPFDSQKIFDNFRKEEIGVEILKYGNVVWCPNCSELVFENNCPHQQGQLSFSGSQIREKIQNRALVPSYFMRPEVQGLLSFSLNPLVDNDYNDKRKSHQKQNGFVLWFTGLPCSGKSTVADLVYKQLKESGLAVERLDGDIVRQSLTKDLGFSREDRDENIRRIGFVAQSLSKNNVGVVASFVSPFEAQRKGVRETTENFIEVFCKCPLEICEQRDIKGLYARARTGQILNFTGISDPYEEPRNPEIVLETDKEQSENSAEKVIQYLKNHNLLK